MGFLTGPVSLIGFCGTSGLYRVSGVGEMVCPESANFYYGENGGYGVSRESMSNPGKPGFSFCLSIQVPLLSYAFSVFSVFSVSSVSVREEKFLHTQLH